MGKTSTLLGALLLSASGLTLHAQEQLYLTPVTSAEGLVDGQQYVLKYTGPGSPINVLLYEEANHTCANNNGWQGTDWNATTILGENPGIIRRQATGSTETPSLTTDDGQYIFTLEAGQGGTFAIKANSGNYVDGRDLTQVVSGKGVPVHSVNASVNKSYFTFTWNSSNSYWNIGNGNSSGRNYLNVGGVDNGCATMWNTTAGTDKGRFQIFSVSDEALSTITLNYRDSKGYTIAPSETVSVPMGQAYTVPAAPEIAHFTNGTPDRPTIESPGATETVTYTYQWDGVPPFQPSTVSGSQWTGGESWFTLFTRNTYWVYNSGANQIDLKDASLSLPYGDEALWCVADAGDGTYKLYNRAAGPSQALTVDGSTVTMGTGTAMELWYYQGQGNNTYPGGWCLNVPGGNNFLNKDMNNSKLALWNNTAARGEIGSVVAFTDVLSDYADLRDEYTATANYVGGYSTEDLAASGLAAATTVDAYNAAFTALNAATPVAIQPGQYYRIVNELRKVGGKPVVLTGGYANGNVGRGTASSARNVGQLWQFEASDEGYKLRNANYAAYAGTLDGSGNNEVHMPLVDADAASTYNLTALSGACWKLADPNNSAHNGVMHCAGNNYIVAWNDGKGSGSSWYIVPVTDIEVAMHSVDADATDTWATLCLPFAVETPDGLTAYTGQADTQAGTVALTEIEDGLVPAGNGVVLKGSAEAYTLAIRPDAEARTLPDNDLTGTTTAQPLAEGSLIYVLGQNQGTPGFYLPNLAQTELSANKAYIDGTPAQALAAGYRFVLGDDETTGIGSVQTPDGPTADQPCYDLQGRRVGQPRQGGVYIQGGKKVYIRK